jgi:hypothetical protein
MLLSLPMVLIMLKAGTGKEVFIIEQRGQTARQRYS